MKVPAQTWEHRRDGRHLSLAKDASLDSSGFTPQALDHLMTLSAAVSYADAVKLAQRLGLFISTSQLQRLMAPLACQTAQMIRGELELRAEEPLQDRPGAKGRVMVVQADGVIVLGHKTGKNVVRDDIPRETGEAFEIKALTVYAQNSPANRFTVAEKCDADDFLPLLAGSLRVAGVRQQDTLISVSDGAPWIEDRMKCLGVTQHVLDVFHAVSYVDRVMEEMGWNDEQRAAERQMWLRGEWDGQTWLQTFASAPQGQRQWSSEAQQALNYLFRRTHLMNYPYYRTQGWPIGSGQIEGINKSVIGWRMKGSGMHWSRPGASGMASLRANLNNINPLVSLDDVRHAAFPIPA